MTKRMKGRMKPTKAKARKGNGLTVKVDPLAVGRGPVRMPRAQVFARKGTSRLKTRAARKAHAVREGSR